MKIVLNRCYGGFSLSYEAMYLYLTAKGQQAYFYIDLSSYEDYTKKPTYKRVSLTEAKTLYKSHFISRFVTCTTSDQGEVLNDYPVDVFYDREVDRTDPILVSIVEIIGSAAASGRFASLYIAEIDDGTLYKIDEYDGSESLITTDDDDWKVASSQTQSVQALHHIQSMWSLIKPTPSNNDEDLTFKY
jgi:hypothetical protein